MNRRFLILCATVLCVKGGYAANESGTPVVTADAPAVVTECNDNSPAPKMKGPEEDAIEASIPEPTGPLTLEQVVALVLIGNPVLTAFSWEIQAAEARTLQEGKYPNPRLSVTADEMRWRRGPKTITNISRYGNGLETERRVEQGAPAGFEDTELTVELSQDFELWAQRAKRVRAAKRERDVVAQEYEVLKSEVLYEVAVTFYTALALQEYVQACAAPLAESALLVENLKKLEFPTALAQQNYLQAGEDPLREATLLIENLRKSEFPILEVKEAEAELSKFKMRQERSKRQLEAARMRLAGAWGSIHPEFECVVGTLDPAAPVPPQSELLQHLTENPDIARCATEIEFREAVIALEKANAVPDLELRCAFRSDRIPKRRSSGSTLGNTVEFENREIYSKSNRDNTFLLGFAIDLPLFDRNQGAILEARHLLSRACADKRAALLRAQTEVLSLREELSAFYGEIETLKGETIPAAQKTVEAVKKGISLGAIPLSDLMKALKEAHDTRSRLLEAHIGYHKTLAGMERLLGAPLMEAEKGPENNAP
ncbi:MAG TPA: TolC family protein [Candidatus Hydrogenedentes bacterium]|nr:TolC family protein [Candidatus Hydrogenedentota bacterium]